MGSKPSPLEITEADEVNLIDMNQLAGMLGCEKQKARQMVEAGDFELIELGPRSLRTSMASYKRFLNRGGRRADV